MIDENQIYAEIVEEVEKRFLSEEEREKKIANAKFPWKDWTLNAELSKTAFDAFKNMNPENQKFAFRSRSVDPKSVKPEDGSGVWLPTAANQDGIPYFEKGALATLDIAAQRFFINDQKTDLIDPRFAAIIKSTILVHPEFADFQVSQAVEDQDDNDSWRSVTVIKDLGVARDLVGSMKTVKGTSPRYTKGDVDLYDQFEIEVFKELSDLVWYHATRKTNLESIQKNGLLPSGEREQGDGWTQLNLHLQNAVYLTRRPDYAEAIAETLAARFKEDAVILKVSGEVLKNSNYQNVVVDEDSLRSELDDMVASTSAHNFHDFVGLPEIIESALHRVASIGYKGVIDSKHIEIAYVFEYDNHSDE